MENGMGEQVRGGLVAGERGTMGGKAAIFKSCILEIYIY